MKKIIVYCLFIFLLTNSCFQNNENSEVFDISVQYNSAGIKTNQPFLWSTQVGTDDINGAVVAIPAIYNNYILVGGEINYKSALYLLDIDDGKVNWSKNFFNTESFFVENYISYVYKNKLIFFNGTYYCINIGNGNIEWRYRTLNADSRLSGIDSLFFGVAQGLDGKYNKDSIAGAYYGLVDDGILHPLYVPYLGKISNPNDYLNGVGGINDIFPYKNKAGDIMLLFYIFSEKDSPSGAAWIDLYNFTKKEFVFKNDTVGMDGSWPPQVYNGKLYHDVSNNGIKIQCLDLSTGKEVWKYDISKSGGIGGNGTVIVDGKLITTVGDVIKYVIALDVETGAVIWKTPSSGGRLASRMNYLNGVVYFTTATDARLHAVDATTGKYLWLMDTPAYKNDYDDYYGIVCFTIPGKNGEKGKVIAVSTKYAYCFEAER